jgi:hypothetical protein
VCSAFICLRDAMTMGQRVQPEAASARRGELAARDERRAEHSERDVRKNERYPSECEPHSEKEQFGCAPEQPYARRCESGLTPEQRRADMKEARAKDEE